MYSKFLIYIFLASSSSDVSDKQGNILLVLQKKQGERIRRKGTRITLPIYYRNYFVSFSWEIPEQWERTNILKAGDQSHLQPTFLSLAFHSPLCYRLLSKQQYSTVGNFAACPSPPPHPQGDIWQCLETFLVVTLGMTGGVSTGMCFNRSGMLPEHSTMPGTASLNKELFGPKCQQCRG